MDKLKFKDKQITGNIGLFFVCYVLSRRGWNVLPTSRNAKGIDILAYSKNGEKPLPIQVQVKGYTEKGRPWIFKNENDVIADFYVTARSVYRIPKTYILTKEEVKKM